MRPAPIIEPKEPTEATEPTEPLEPDNRTWHASRSLSLLLRAVAFLTPFLLAWFVVHSLADAFWRPDGGIGLLLWVIQASLAGLVTTLTVDRFTRRLLPLATLYNVSLVFPDKAPSRFSVALRTGTVTNLTSQEDADGQRRTPSNAEAAQAAVELLALLRRHDRFTRGHTERVRAYSDVIAKELGLSDADRNKLAWGAILHDIGKLAVPEEILNKNGRPTTEEWQVLKTHPAEGEDLLDPLREWLGPWLLATSQHHERWDGKGYPLGLAGTDISLAGRIVAVADAYDVITSKRAYKRAMSPEAGRRELVRCAGTQFDPAIVRAFVNVSLGRRWRVGPLAWILEAARRGANLGAVPGAVATSVVVAGGVITFDPPPKPASAETPAELALTEDDGDAPADDAVVIDDTDAGSASGPASAGTSTGGSPSPGAFGPANDPSSSPPIVGTTTEPTTTSTTPTTVPPTTSSPTTPPITTPSTSVPGTEAPGSGGGTGIDVPPIEPPLGLPPIDLPPINLPPILPTTTTTTTTTSPPGPAGDTVALDDTGYSGILGLIASVLDNDSGGGVPLDPDSLEIIIAPQHGTAWVYGGQIHYVQNLFYIGADSLEYQVCNTADQVTCDTATLSITAGF